MKAGETPCGAAGGADEAGVAAELGVFDPRLCGRHREGHCVNVGADIFKERLSGGDHSSAKEYDVGVDRVHEGDGTDREVMCCLTHQAARQWIAGVRRLGYRPAGELVVFQDLKETGTGVAVESLVGTLDQRRRRRVTLQMSVGAAGTLRPFSISMMM